MIPTTFELREVKKPARFIQIKGDTLNLENILTPKISEGIAPWAWNKITLTLSLKSGEILIYENMDKGGAVVQTILNRNKR